MYTHIILCKTTSSQEQPANLTGACWLCLLSWRLCWKRVFFSSPLPPPLLEFVCLYASFYSFWQIVANFFVCWWVKCKYLTLVLLMVGLGFGVSVTDCIFKCKVLHLNWTPDLWCNYLCFFSYVTFTVYYALVNKLCLLKVKIVRISTYIWKSVCFMLSKSLNILQTKVKCLHIISRLLRWELPW